MVSSGKMLCSIIVIPVPMNLLGDEFVLNEIRITFFRLWNTWDLSAVAEFSAMSPSPVTRYDYSFYSSSVACETSPSNHPF